MSQNIQYNPLEIKEGLIHRVINWCKSRTKSIITVGSIGLVLTGIQTYKTVFEPDTALEIHKIIKSTIHEYKTIEPVTIPDSVLKCNKEIQLLKSYQEEFDIYFLYLQSLNVREIREENEIVKFSLYKSRYEMMLAYGIESQRMLEKAQEIFFYEKNVAKNEKFGITINMDLMHLILEMQKKVHEEQQATLTKLSTGKHRDWKSLTALEKEKIYTILENGYASETLLKTIELQTEFYKSLYLSISIRLKEIMRDYK